MRGDKAFYSLFLSLGEKRIAFDLILCVCVCERERKVVHIWENTHISLYMPNWMAGGGVGSIFNVSLDLSLKGKQNEKEK